MKPRTRYFMIGANISGSDTGYSAQEFHSPAARAQSYELFVTEWNVLHRGWVWIALDIAPDGTHTTQRLEPGEYGRMVEQGITQFYGTERES